MKHLPNILIWLVATVCAQATAQDKPNFVWLIAEDSSKHYYNLFDAHGIATPNIEKLASSGVKFDFAFSNSPVCSVARTTLITGCYAPRLGTQFHRKFEAVELHPGIEMFPARLRASGYFTTNKAKKDYNAIEPKGVWDQSSRRASWRNRKPGQPFFHCQSFSASHESSLHFDRNAVGVQPTTQLASKVKLAPYFPDTKLFRYTVARYLDQVSKVDKQIGNVVADLKNDQLLQSTFIFFFGDHGGVLPRSKTYLYETGLHVPLVVHVPKKFAHLVDGQFAPGSTSTRYVSFVDFAPTVLNLAGVDGLQELDGKPFLGKALSLKPEKNDAVFGYADRFDEKIDMARSVRMGRFKYIRNFCPHYPDALHNNYRFRMLAYQQWRTMFESGRLNKVQSQFFVRKPVEALFDVIDDPFETKNLATVDDHRQTLEAMRSLLNKWMLTSPDISFFPEHVLAKNAFESPVKFGTDNKNRIAQFIEIANLALDFSERTVAKLELAFDSSDPWQRYWALRAACAVESTDQLRSLMPKIRELARDDSEPLNRIACAELLAIHTEDDVRPIFEKAIRATSNPIELTSILNSAVAVQNHFNKPIQLKQSWFSELPPDPKNYVRRRLSYLIGGASGDAKE